MLKPKAVLISDIHFNINNLELSTIALNHAARKAEELNVPLIIDGDLLDQKSIIRAECANRLLNIFQDIRLDNEIYLVVGNHDLLNERGKEHSLHFLERYSTVVVDKPIHINGFNFIPYQSSNDDFLKALYRFPKGSTIIAHQGVQGAYLGDYVIDKSSVPREELDGYRIISGHYHRAQDIKCGETGLVTYIGSPFTMSFGEANDGPKGYRILMDDGTAPQVILKFRKHIIAERNIDNLYTPIENYKEGDLLWLKVSGPQLELDKLDKTHLGNKLLGHTNFKLDKIPIDIKVIKEDYNKLSNNDILDKLIDVTDESVESKKYLKTLWREVLG